MGLFASAWVPTIMPFAVSLSLILSMGVGRNFNDNTSDSKADIFFVPLMEHPNFTVFRPPSCQCKYFFHVSPLQILSNHT